MDASSFLHLVVIVLVTAVLLTIAYLIIKKWIMPAVDPAIQLYVWAVLGVILLIVICYVLLAYVSNGSLTPHRGY
jgi:uncharacterized membrane protein YidH (DUF202 family)